MRVRLLVADCKDDDVDDVLLAILNPLLGEDATKTGRSRAVVAALCLADEPNVSEETANKVLAKFACSVGTGDGGGHVTSSLDAAAMDLGCSIWVKPLREKLIYEYCIRPAKKREQPGGLWGMVEVAMWNRSGLRQAEAFAALRSRLESGDRVEAVSAALSAMEAAFEEKAALVEGLIEGLLLMLKKGGAESHAAAWALVWLNGGWMATSKKPAWQPSESELQQIADALRGAPDQESETKICLLHILGKSSSQRYVGLIIRYLGETEAGALRSAIEALGKLGDKQAVPPLLGKLDHQNASIRMTVIEALGKLGDKQAVPPLLGMLDDQDPRIRRAVIEALGKLGDKLAIPPLLGKLDDEDLNLRVAAFAAVSALDRPTLITAMTPSFVSEKHQVRQLAVRTYALLRESWDKRLLSRDLDAASPWLDPLDQVTETQVAKASLQLGITPEEVRSRFEAIAIDLGLKLAWKR